MRSNNKMATPVFEPVTSWHVVLPIGALAIEPPCPTLPHDEMASQLPHILTSPLRNKSNQLPTLLHLWTHQWLGQNVCWHLSCWNKQWINSPSINNIPQPIPAQVQVLHSPMMFRILCNTDSRLVVHAQNRRSMLWIS